MAEPFVFHFKPGPTGKPEILYMLDLDCVCGLCGHVQLQRFYHSAPFHTLTLEGLVKRADEASLKAGYACENCGEAVGANEVRRTSLTFGFADDSGVIRIFDDLMEGRRRFEVTAKHRLDPQAVPRFFADENAHGDGHYVLDELDEDKVEELLGRPFNLKLAWRDLLEDWFEDPEGGAFSQLAEGLWVVIDDGEQAAGDLIEEMDDEDFWDAYDGARLAVISLHDSIPEGLATQEDPARLSGRWAQWIPEPICEAIEAGELWADAYISRELAIEVVKRAFDVARLTYRCHDTEADVFFVDITTPTGVVYGRGVSISSILRRAVYTGISPGEAARLTAEEIIGTLLQVWK